MFLVKAGRGYSIIMKKGQMIAINNPKVKYVLSSKYFTAKGPSNPPNPNKVFITLYQNCIFPILEIFMIEKVIEDSNKAKKVPL